MDAIVLPASYVCTFKQEKYVCRDSAAFAEAMADVATSDKKRRQPSPHTQTTGDGGRCLCCTRLLPTTAAIALSSKVATWLIYFVKTRSLEKRGKLEKERKMKRAGKAGNNTWRTCYLDSLGESSNFIHQSLSFSEGATAKADVKFSVT